MSTSDLEPTIDIRPPTNADCPAAAECQIVSWLETYDKLIPQRVLAAFAEDLPNRIKNWHSRISRPELTTLIACTREDGHVVGFATADRVAGPTGRKELHSVYVLRPWWGKGIGKCLMDGVLEGEHVAAEVCVLEENWEARNWYERQGFGKEVGERRLNQRIESWEVTLVRQ